MRIGRYKSMTHPKTFTAGLRENWQQILLLVIVNGFVGAMVGMERSILPLLAESDFGLGSHAALLSFLISFGFVKAFANLFAGGLAQRFGRKTTLITGWIFALPIPFILMFAKSWSWIIFANVLLGINQGLCWSSTVLMKIDLAKARQRGLAAGLNESSGYLAVSGSAILTGYLAARFGLRPAPFLPGIFFALTGLLVSLFLIKETLYANQRHLNGWQEKAAEKNKPGYLRGLVFTSQAGMVNNMNDAVIWGLLPVLLFDSGLLLEQIAVIASIYPAVWGSGQLIMGFLSDRIGRKGMITAGMWLQAVGISFFVFLHGFGWWIVGSVLLGVGTAMVYPTLLASVSDSAPDLHRSRSLGIYRFFRDSGFAFGALFGGIAADSFGIPAAMGGIGALTFLSGLVFWLGKSGERSFLFQHKPLF